MKTKMIRFFFLFIAFASADSATQNTTSSPSPTHQFRKKCPPRSKKVNGRCIYENPCEAGHAPRSGDGECLSCGAGFFANKTEVRCTSCPAGKWSEPMSGSCTGTPCVSGDGPKGATTPDQAFCVESCSFMQWRDIESCSSSGILAENCTCSMRIKGSVVFWINVATATIILLCKCIYANWDWGIPVFFTLCSLGGTCLKVDSLSIWEQLSPYAIVFTCLVPFCSFLCFAFVSFQKLIKWCKKTAPSSLIGSNMSAII